MSISDAYRLTTLPLFAGFAAALFVADMEGVEDIGAVPTLFAMITRGVDKEWVNRRCACKECRWRFFFSAFRE